MPRFGIIGCGKIAKKFLQTLNFLNIEVEAVASTSLSKAKEYKETYHANKYYTSYVDLVKDPNVDMVYVATIHSKHFEHIKLCIEHNKPVICEKAFTVNAKEAKDILALASERKVLVMEAMWTRFLPCTKAVKELIDSKKYGNVKSMFATFAYDMDTTQVNRITSKDMGGGALLDIGVYPLNYADYLLGLPTKVVGSGHIVKGVDLTVNFDYYVGDVVAKLSASVEQVDFRDAKIELEKAYIVIPRFWRGTGYKVYDYSDNLLEEASFPFELDGFEYQIRSFIETYEKGELENEIMPHSKTIEMMEIIDKINELILK